MSHEHQTHQRGHKARVNQRVGCAGQDCPYASTCAAHTLASEMSAVRPRLCAVGKTFSNYEPLPDQPVRLIRPQADWIAMPKHRPLPNSVFAYCQVQAE